MNFQYQCHWCFFTFPQAMAGIQVEVRIHLKSLIQLFIYQ